jgi:hypothetical protein
MSFGKVRIYTEGLAHHLSTSDEEFNALMSGNARALYRF